MARRTPSTTQVTRKDTDDTADLGIRHEHDGKPHLHRLGNLPHEHNDATGKAVYLGDDGRPAFTNGGGPLSLPSPAALIQAAGNSHADSTDRDFAELTEIVETAQTLRWEGETLIELLSVIKEMKRQAAGRGKVNPDLIVKGRGLFESWVIQRGIGEAGS